MIAGTILNGNVHHRYIWSTTSPTHHAQADEGQDAATDEER